MDRFGSFTSSMLDAKKRLGGNSESTSRPRFSSRLPSVRLRCYSGVEPTPAVSTGVTGFVSRMVSSASGRLHGLNRLRRHRIQTSQIPHGTEMEEFSCYNHFTARSTAGFLERSWVSAFYLPDAVSDNTEDDEQVLVLKMRKDSFKYTAGSEIEDIANVLDNSSLTSPFLGEDNEDSEDEEALLATNSANYELSPEPESKTAETSPDSPDAKDDDACSHQMHLCEDEDYDADTDANNGISVNNETNENVDSDANRSRPSSRGAASIEFKLSTATIRIGRKTELNISQTDLIPKCIVTTVMPAHESSVLQTKSI